MSPWQKKRKLASISEDAELNFRNCDKVTCGYTLTHDLSDNFFEHPLPVQIPRVVIPVTRELFEEDHTMEHIKQAFGRCKEQNRAALVGFTTAGYPTIDETPDILLGMEAGGVGE